MSRWRGWVVAAVWATSVVGLIADLPGLRILAPALLVPYLVDAALRARRETLLVVGLVVLFGAWLLVTEPAGAPLLDGLERALLFAALLPTLRLTRAVARRLAPVRLAEQRLAALPERQADVGILLGSHVFGSMLNTGAFAIMSSVVPDEANDGRRRRAAQASLRGMNTAILWSPFFVGFAVASTYLPGVPAWQVIGAGLVTSALVLTIAIVLFARPLDLASVGAALRCLGPIAPGMLVAGGAVVGSGAATDLSALGAVLVVMPVLAGACLLARPGLVRPVVAETWAGMQRMGDELLLVTAAMVLGTLAERSELVRAWLQPLLGTATAGWQPIALLVASMVLPGMLGVHPMITGTVTLATMMALGQPVADLVLMEAMLLGWSLGSMVSIASLSVVTSGVMYRTPAVGLAYGPNLGYVAVASLSGVLWLAALDAAIGS